MRCQLVNFPFLIRVNKTILLFGELFFLPVAFVRLLLATLHFYHIFPIFHILFEVTKIGYAGWFFFKFCIVQCSLFEEVNSLKVDTTVDQELAHF